MPKEVKPKLMRNKARPKAVKRPSRASNEKRAPSKRVAGDGKHSTVAEPSVGHAPKLLSGGNPQIPKGDGER